MRKKSSALFVFSELLVASFLLWFGAASAQEKPQPPDRPPGHATAQAGKYNVGYQFLKLPAGGDQPLVCALWYPTDAEATSQKYVPAQPHLEGKVALNAAPAKGPFPLVISSHGGVGAGVCAMTWAEALAAEGFVVAAPDHKDKVILLRSDMDGPPSREQILKAVQWAMKLSRAQGGGIDKSEFEHRPGEIRAVIDGLLKLSADEKSGLHGLVDAERIGLTGISFGSWTTLVVAGGVAQYHDPRVKAAIPMAPQVGGTDRAKIHVPLMTIFGDKETMALLDKKPDAPLKIDHGIMEDYANANPPKFLIGIKGAEHMDFDADGMTTRGSMRDRDEQKSKVYTTEEVRKNDPLIRAIVRYQIAFWRRYLLSDSAAEKVLTTGDEKDLCVFEWDLGEGKKGSLKPSDEPSKDAPEKPSETTPEKPSENAPEKDAEDTAEKTGPAPVKKEQTEAVSNDWEMASPADAGMDAAKLEAAMKFAGERNSNGVVVVRKGKIVAEQYWKDWNKDSTGDMCSAQKSITSTLIGIAIDAGLIKGLDQSAADFLTGWKGTPKEKITIRHLLSMTSGLLSSKRSDLFTALRSRDQEKYALALELEHEPGTFWAYGNPAYTLVNSILDRATGMSRNDYAKKALFAPLGMEHSECQWVTLNERFKLKHHGIKSSCRDMARFGQFILQSGKWKDKQLVNKDFIAQATKRSQDLNPAYGFLWWLNGSDRHRLPYEESDDKGMLFPGCPPDTFAALGAKDSKIYVVPSLDLVVSRLGGAATKDGGVAPSEFDAPFLKMICDAVVQKPAEGAPPEKGTKK